VCTDVRYVGGLLRGITVWGRPWAKKEREKDRFWKITKEKKSWVMAQVVEWLPSKNKVLSSNASPIKKGELRLQIKLRMIIRWSWNSKILQDELDEFNLNSRICERVRERQNERERERGRFLDNGIMVRKGQGGWLGSWKRQGSSVSQFLDWEKVRMWILPYSFQKETSPTYSPGRLVMKL
jgi:hypothetical protein